MKKFIDKYIYFLFILILSGSCENMDQEINIQENYTNSIYISLEDFKINNTRASGSGWNAQWGVDGFKEGDTAGLYTYSGNANVNDGQGGFENVEMTFISAATSGGFSQFTNDNLNINPTMMYQGEKINMYLGYQSDMTLPPGPGKELRVLPEGETDYRCIDFIKSIGWTFPNGRINVRFNHCFSILILTLGEGFSIQPNPDITVVLTKGYSHIGFGYNRVNWIGYPQLIYMDNYIPTGSNQVMSEKDCRKWKAWRGGDYQGKPAWYVFLPTNEQWSIEKQSIISYIEVRDDNGNIQKISSFNLDNGNSTKALYTQNVYPLNIVMDDLEPTIFPYPIQKWEGDTDITQKRDYGINDENEFIEWMQAYNAFIASNRNTDNESALYSFGDNIDGIWHFYLLNDLDFSNYNTPLYFPQFNDCLDGRSTLMENSSFINYKISNISSTKPLIGTLGETGELICLDFDNIFVNDDNNSSLAAICESIKGGNINNCNIINGTVVSKGQVGLLSTEILSGSISNCYFSGFLLGSSTSFSYRGLFCNNPPENIFTSNLNYKDIIVATE